MRYFSYLSALAFSALLLLLAGCQTPLRFAAPGADWQTQRGQLHYLDSTGRSLVGDVIVRRLSAAHEFRLEFSAGSGVPLLRLAQNDQGVRAEGVFAGGTWQGLPESAPKRLQGWVRLHEVFAEVRLGRTQLRGPTWSAVCQYAGNQPQQLVVTFSDRPERFAFHFAL